ncbi:MAG: hypothetical protein GYB65_07860 [Chloroflexi bacterium]|nr:hypothetical protein [Chloroflexota bacterium]
MTYSPFSRRSRTRSSRGHVRVTQTPNWPLWVAAGLGIILVLITLGIVIRRLVAPLFDEDSQPGDNRTWLHFSWAETPPDPDVIDRLATRLEDNEISLVYFLGTGFSPSTNDIVDGPYRAEFMAALRDAYPDVRILLWLYMEGESLLDLEQQARAVDLSSRAVSEWGYDGVHLNINRVVSGSPTFIKLVTDVRDVIGPDAFLSVMVPPDYRPVDASIPTSPIVIPAEYTWEETYKQEVGLLNVDEIVIQAFASGLDTTADYELWAAYQVESYTVALDQFDFDVDVVIALPTYEPINEGDRIYLDPDIENIRAAINAAKQGISQAGEAGDRVTGVGVYEYAETDDLEWSIFRELWLGED